MDFNWNNNFELDYLPFSNEISLLNENEWNMPTYLSRPKWLGFAHEGKPYRLVKKNRCFEYQVEEIYNPYLERAFQLKKSQSGLNSLDVFHGTESKNIDSIMTNNFNWRLSGASRGWKHGKGVCFSGKESFVHQFCRGQNKQIIVTRILFRRSSVGTQGQLLPAYGYDSTQSPNGNVVVKFEDSEFLPLRIYNYDTIPEISLEDMLKNLKLY